MNTLTYSGTLVIRTCWCGMRHAIPEELGRAAEYDKNVTVHCPVGHEWVSTAHEKRESEKLRERLAQEQQRRQATQSLLAAEERSHRATRGVVTRQKKKLVRVTNGVCPCCNRTFQNLMRHMDTKHPEYKPAVQHDEKEAAA